MTNSQLRIDLHTHSNASDGTEAPAEVMRQAAVTGLDVVALSDHDTAEGWPSALEEAQRLGLGFVPAMEVSSRLEHRSVHVLAYLLDPSADSIVSMLDRVRHSREHRAEAMVEAIARDFPITWDDVAANVAPGATIGRPHIADALIAAGVVEDRTQAFEYILHPTSPYFVDHYAPSPLEAVRAIVAAGGVPVIAHPSGVRGKAMTEPMLAELVDAGLFGVEVEHRDNSEAGKFWLTKMADRYGLVTTGSSDYHGDGKPNRLGEHMTVPAVLGPILSRGTGARAWIPDEVRARLG